MRWLDSVTEGTSMNLTKFQEAVEDRRAWRALVHRCMEIIILLICTCAMNSEDYHRDQNTFLKNPLIIYLLFKECHNTIIC